MNKIWKKMTLQLTNSFGPNFLILTKTQQQTLPCLINNQRHNHNKILNFNNNLHSNNNPFYHLIYSCHNPHNNKMHNFSNNQHNSQFYHLKCSCNNRIKVKMYYSLKLKCSPLNNNKFYNPNYLLSSNNSQ